MSLRLTLRSGSLSEWATAEAAGNGKLRKGEIGVGWIEVGGSITEVVMRIGPNATPTAFSACPVITRSPLTAIGSNIKIPVVDVSNKTDAIVTLSGGSFSAVADDPGTYDSTDDGGGGPIAPSETPPAITSVSLARGATTIAQNGTLSLSHDGSVSDMTLTVVATGSPAPIVTAVMETTSGAVNLTGTASSGTWSFAVPLSSTATGLHVITITADSTVQPDAVATRSFTVARAPAPPVATIAITSLQLKNNSTNAVVSTVANGSGITLRADVTTNPTSATTTTYQWRRGQAAISGATSQTYALVAGDNDSNVSCVVTVTNVVSGVTATATATASVAVGTVESGWTALSPASDSRLIYVDAVNGDDAAAAAVNGGKGYYLPSHAAIGADPSNPVGPITAYKTPAEASKRVRLSGCTGETASGFPLYGQNWGLSTHLGFPDWLLFRRGQTHDLRVTIDNQTRNVGRALGDQFWGWEQAGGGQFRPYCGMWRGRSSGEPAVLGAWGPTTEARPVLTAAGATEALAINGAGKHLRYVSLDVSGVLGWTFYSAEYGYLNDAGDVIVEDVRARSFGATGAARFVNGATIRRSQALDNFNPGGHNQGIFISGPSKWVLEECVIDRNGYKENPNEPTTWTGRLVSSLSPGEVAPGTGVQPTRTYFDRNIYASSYDSLVVRGCILSRGGGGWSFQSRQGGVAERNLFIFCESAIAVGHPQASNAGIKSSLLRSNLVLHDDHMLPPGGWGGGIWLGGTEDDVSVADDNVIAHFHRGSNGGGAITVTGKGYHDESLPAAKLGRGVVKDNAVQTVNGGYGLMVLGSGAMSGVAEVDVTGNEIAGNALLSMNGNSPRLSNSTYSGNRFYSASTSSSLFKWNFNFASEYYVTGTTGDLAGWKAAGYDSDAASVSTDFAAFKTAVGWTAPERDIVSYMESVDPTYVVNEDVFVDDDATGTKQATRQKVWQVLQAGIPGTIGGMTEERAKLTARRYHAFITFIQRARANRKGAWDPRWTAEAVNNYVREGFGKPAVTGAYTATLAAVGSY